MSKDAAENRLEDWDDVFVDIFNNLVFGGHEIIKEEDLIEALNSDVIAGAFLDVTKTEPLPAEDPLWNAKNILITPHRAAYGDQMQRKMCALIGRNVRHWLAGEKMEDRIL